MNNSKVKENNNNWKRYLRKLEDLINYTFDTDRGYEILDVYAINNNLTDRYYLYQHLQEKFNIQDMLNPYISLINEIYFDDNTTPDDLKSFAETIFNKSYVELETEYYIVGGDDIDFIDVATEYLLTDDEKYFIEEYYRAFNLKALAEEIALKYEDYVYCIDGIYYINDTGTPF